MRPSLLNLLSTRSSKTHPSSSSGVRHHPYDSKGRKPAARKVSNRIGSDHSRVTLRGETQLHHPMPQLPSNSFDPVVQKFDAIIHAEQGSSSGTSYRVSERRTLADSPDFEDISGRTASPGSTLVEYGGTYHVTETEHFDPLWEGSSDEAHLATFGLNVLQGAVPLHNNPYHFRESTLDSASDITSVELPHHAQRPTKPSEAIEGSMPYFMPNLLASPEQPWLTAADLSPVHSLILSSCIAASYSPVINTSKLQPSFNNPTRQCELIPDHVLEYRIAAHRIIVKSLEAWQ